MDDPEAVLVRRFRGGVGETIQTAEVENNEARHDWQGLTPKCIRPGSIQGVEHNKQVTRHRT